jgi:hypothetical protein
MSGWVFVAPTAGGKEVFAGAAGAVPVPPAPALPALVPAPASFAPAAREQRLLLAVLVLACGLFAVLWFSGLTWWRPAWYALAVLQGVAATMLLVAGTHPSSLPPWAVLGLLLCCGAPLAQAVLLEVVLEDPDRGDGRTAWAVTAGKAVSVAALAGALAAGYGMWRGAS